MADDRALAAVVGRAHHSFCEDAGCRYQDYLKMNARCIATYPGGFLVAVGEGDQEVRYEVTVRRR